MTSPLHPCSPAPLLPGTLAPRHPSTSAQKWWMDSGFRGSGSWSRQGRGIGEGELGSGGAVAPKKKLNVAIAGVLGLMVGVFGIFVMEYFEGWGEGGKEGGRFR